MSTPPPSHPRIVLAAIAALGFWASAFVGTRVALASFSPGELALYRYGVASLTLAVLALRLRPPLPRRQALPRLVATGAIGIGVYTLALNTGQQTTTADRKSTRLNSSHVA